MTIGAPIYLVSACTSGEEFVAAFRRYADRNGVVFVPIAEPLPAGTKARFALTLRDGGVMVDGRAEVVSSARTPSILYGRVGMTVKFLEPDAPSKTVLGELEKARLALKPLPLSVAPRAAEVPAEPRPRPPVPSGRIDAVNALAECVAIGEGIPRSTSDTVPPKNPNPKFVVPSLPSVPGTEPRPKTPSMPPSTSAVRPPAATEHPIDVSQTMRGPVPSPRMATPSAPMPIVQRPAPITRLATSEIEFYEPTELTPIPLGVADDKSSSAIPGDVPTDAKAEKEKAGRETRKTVLGIAVVPSGVMVLPGTTAPRVAPDEGNRDTSPLPAQPPASTHSLSDTVPAQPVPPTVEEATPSGDWTMTPGANGPTITPTPRASDKPGPAGPPTGDWLIALDPSQPDGWSEPSNVNRLIVDPEPPMSVVSNETPLDSARVLPEPAQSSEPKVQIDPSLIEPPTSPQPPLMMSQPFPTAAQVMSAPTYPSYSSGPPVGFDPHYSAVRDQPTVEAGGGRRRIIIIGAVAAAVIIGLIVMVFGGGGGGAQSSSTSGSGAATHAITPDKPVKPNKSDDVVKPPLDAGIDRIETPVAIDAAVAVAATECNVAISSVPAGAEITIDKASVGTTPAILPLPCGVAIKVVLRKNRYAVQSRSFTPKAEGQKPIKITLARVTFSVKVNSTPAGATIMVGTKTMGVTPTTVKLPAFELSTLKIRKDGFTTETQKITPKQNSQSVHATLKKLPKRVR